MQCHWPYFSLTIFLFLEIDLWCCKYQSSLYIRHNAIRTTIILTKGSHVSASLMHCSIALEHHQTTTRKSTYFFGVISRWARTTIKWGKHSDRHLPVGGNKLCQKQTRFNLALWGATTEHRPCARMFPFIKMSVRLSARLGNVITFPTLFKTLLVYNIWSAALFRYLILNGILRACVSVHKTILFLYQTNSVQASYLVSAQKC